MPDIWALTAVVTKVLLYFGILTSGGLIMTRFVFAPEVSAVLPVVRKAAAFWALVGFFAALLSFALRGAALTGEASGMMDAEMMGLLWKTSVGTALVLRVLGLSLVLVGLLIGGVGWTLAGAGALIAIWSFATIGHVTDSGGILSKLSLMLHLVAVSFWIGILLPLKRLIASSDTILIAGQLGDRFGQIAAIVIPGLFLAGLFLAWTLVGSWTSLVTTSYGLALIAKLCFVACLLGLGALNKLRFVPGVISGDGQAVFYLRSALRIEGYLFVIVLIGTAALTTLFALPEGH